MQGLNLDIEKVKSIKYNNFIELLKSGHFKKISFMTGAGISTTAGIPDFRSSGSGLFKTLQNKYKLSTPEEFFEIETFLKKPELFYEFAKEFDVTKYSPTPTHVFNLLKLVVHELLEL
jgi:NAD-dependent histone deacetylase SIR2